MAGYSPMKITGMQTGLIQEREEFILPNDAYPVLENAFVWRERIKRKRGTELLGRLQRGFSSSPVTLLVNGSGQQNLIIGFSLQTNSSLVPGTITINIFGTGTNFTDPNADGNLFNGVTLSGTINYSTGSFTIVAAAGLNILASFFYNPNLPVMGLRSREINSINDEETIAFDTKYAYVFDFTANSWKEFIPGTVWTGNDSDFFWSTNYWVGTAPANKRLFWVTNFNDPIRYTDDSAWINFTPQINNAGDLLENCLCLLPFRSRLVAFNTFEAGGAPYPQRIRWSAIGNPITQVSAIVTVVNPNAWRDDIRGQGGFLDIPTSEAIVSVGFVRDNLVVYCERSTWQLRYTGRSIAPFQIERVNSELGSESTFSAVQFDTSLVGIGDKGIVECDSYKSDRIDIKIPDLVFQFNNEDNGTKRIHGIRDFAQRLAYWTYPYAPNDSQEPRNKFPDKRLVYNYENDSWAIFDDSFTCFGNFQPQNSLTWASVNGAWKDQNYPWITRPALFPALIAGNQQGYVHYIDNEVDNDVSLYITNITGNTPNPTVITSINHNLLTGAVVEISIPSSQPFGNLNGQRFGVVRVDADNFQLWIYNPISGQFNLPQTDSPSTYIGIGQVIVVDNFRIVSKKFNFLDEGQNIQLGYIDILMNNTEDGAISLNVYLDYNDNDPTNIPPDNSNPDTQLPDTFFNSIVPTSVPATSYRGSSKNWQRVFCPTRGAFLTIEWTLSNAQMVGVEQGNDVQIDASILWVRRAGKQLPVGI